jgi:hypothetical protein
VAARQGAPVIGAICAAGHEGEGGPTVATTQSTAHRWNLTMGYRYQNSFRHFRGDVEQTERLAEETQVENNLNMFDFGLSYQINPRWSVNVSAPFMHVTRVSHRNDTLTKSTGVGDMSIGAKFWLWRPPSENQQNVQIGFGMKLPTGNPNVTANQSIQQGDSGTGVSFDIMGYKSIRRFTTFASATYLVNPKNSYVPKGWVRNGPAAPVGYQGFSQPGTVFSVPDQYLMQVGGGYAVPKLAGFAVTSSVRMEGVPARDLIGREDGFRRPGYAVSVAPGFMYSRAENTWSVSTPIAIKRDRTRSVPDIRNNSHGDAAFADWLLLISYSKSF